TAPRDPSIAARSLPSWGPGQPDRPAVERQWLAYCCHMPTPARPLPVVGGDRRASVSCYLDGASGFILEFEKAEPELGTGELWRQRLSAACTYCHVGIFRAWRHSRPDDRCAIGAVAPRTCETNRQRHRACAHDCEGQYPHLARFD